MLNLSITHGGLGTLLVPVLVAITCACVERGGEEVTRGRGAWSRHEIASWHVLAKAAGDLFAKVLVAMDTGHCAVLVVLKPGLGCAAILFCQQKTMVK